MGFQPFRHLNGKRILFYFQNSRKLARFVILVACLTLLHHAHGIIYTLGSISLSHQLYFIHSRSVSGAHLIPIVSLAIHLNCHRNRCRHHHHHHHHHHHSFHQPPVLLTRSHRSQFIHLSPSIRGKISNEPTNRQHLYENEEISHLREEEKKKTIKKSKTELILFTQVPNVMR